MSEAAAPSTTVLNAPEGKLVLAAIHAVMEDLAKQGVGKLKTNAAQNFKYRGIDDVMDAVSQSLSRHHLLILPSVVEHTFTVRETKSGGSALHALLKLNYEFICPIDGSVKVSGPWYAEAIDTGDKATSKAMAIGYKYFATQTFCIPITGMDDPDAHVHELAQPTAAPAPVPVPTRQVPPKGPTAVSSLPFPVPARADGKPAALRPTGNFGYGKKYRDVPFNVMATADLEWFLAAERTPQNIRERIVDELSWREYETAQLEAGIARQREADSAELNDDIP